MAKRTTLTFDPVVEKLKNATTTQVLYALIIVLVLSVGYLFGKVQTLESDNKPATTVQDNSTEIGTQQDVNPDTLAEEPFIAEDLNPGDLPPKGDPNAPVTIVEFSDFQCPFCRRFYEDTLSQLEEEYINTGKAVLYYRHYPLNFHPMAQATAEAAECANDQSKFWEMHDKIFEEQAAQGTGTIEYTEEDIKTWAGEIGFNQEEFNSCLDSGKYTEKVQTDFDEGTTAGVDGTPSFFINGERLVGAQPFEAFEAVIDKKLAE